jgi:DNA-binding HxlR family transcriptional regulator
MKKQVETCKVNKALDIIVGKWKPIILLHLFENSTMRFNELKRSMPGITQKMLTQQLRELEEEDLVHREVYPQVPPKVEYSITEHGKTIEPILEAMHEWGAAHLVHKHYKTIQDVKLSEGADES